jgi:hypothetical protein
MTIGDANVKVKRESGNGGVTAFSASIYGLLQMKFFNVASFPNSKNGGNFSIDAPGDTGW